MTRLAIPHELGRDEALRRLQDAALKHEVRLVPEGDGFAGSVERSAGFLGTIRGRYEVGEREVVLTVTEKPAFRPQDTLRRMLEEELVPAFQPRPR